MQRTLKDYIEIEQTLRSMLTQLAVQYRKRKAVLRKALEFAQARQKQILLFTVKAVLIFSLGYIHGCCTAKGLLKLGDGACKDVGWMCQKLDENIQPEKSE